MMDGSGNRSDEESSHPEIGNEIAERDVHIVRGNTSLKPVDDHRDIKKTDRVGADGMRKNQITRTENVPVGTTVIERIVITNAAKCIIEAAD